MYITWKRRRLRQEQAGASARHRPSTHCPHATDEERYAFTPHVVRSRRVNGKPRQATVLTLPTIRTCCLFDPQMRARWWHQVDARISRLGTADSPRFIDSGMATDLRYRLASIVPPPPPAVLAAYIAEEEARRAREREAALRLDEGFFTGLGHATTTPSTMPAVPENRGASTSGSTA